MKILVPHWHNALFKDDTDVLLEGLTKLGHEMIEIRFYPQDDKVICQPFDKRNLKDIDLIWAPYEVEIRMANYFKQKTNAPILGHFEWVAPWRVGGDPIYWGYDKTNIPELIVKKLEFHKNRYGCFIKEYLTCDAKTIIDQYFLKTIEEFGNIKITNYHIKPYVIDDKLLMLQKDDTIKQKNQILTTARLVPHKRVHHIIEALSKVKHAPPYKVIGVGPENPRLVKLAKDLNVDVKFVGTGQHGIKAKLIQESLFSINIWAGLPVSESAIFKKHALSYYHGNTYTACGKMASYAKWNDIDDLANKIQYLVDNPKITKELGEKSYKSFMSAENRTVPSKEGCLIMEKIFKKVIK